MSEKIQFNEVENDYNPPFCEVKVRYELVRGKNGKYYEPTPDRGDVIVRKGYTNGISGGKGYGKYGVLNKYGIEAVPCEYDSCRPLEGYSDLFVVGEEYTTDGLGGDDYSFAKQKYGIVNCYGETILPLEYSSIYEVSRNGEIHAEKNVAHLKRDVDCFEMREKKLVKTRVEHIDHVNGTKIELLEAEQEGLLKQYDDKQREYEQMKTPERGRDSHEKSE